MIALLATVAFARTELTVEQAMSAAVEHNPDVRSADLQRLVAEISESRARLDRFTATLGVDGDLGVGVTSGDPSTNGGTTSADGGWSTTATASVPLYAGGRVEAAIDQADADADIARLDEAMTERDVLRAAYTAYWNARGLELQIAAAREGIDASKEALAIIQSKAENGLAAGIDVNRSTVNLLSQEESVLRQEAALEQARAQLVQLLASDDPDLVLVSDPPAANVDPAVALAADPLAARPEIARQQRSADRADAQKRLALSAALPNVAVTGTASVGADQSCLGTAGTSTCTSSSGAFGPGPLSADVLTTPIASGTLGVSLRWNPFDLFRVRDAVDQAKLGIRQVEAANESERNRLLADVRAAAANVKALRERSPIVDQQVALARDNQGIVQDLYAQGSATILDLFDAQTAFRSAAIQQAALQVDLATAELDLRWLQGEDLLSGVSP